MKRLPFSPRLRLLCVLLAAPIVYILFFADPRPKRPAFDPYADGLEESYRIQESHVLEDEDEGWRVPGLDNLKGLGTGLLKARQTVLVTGGAGQLGTSISRSRSCSHRVAAEAELGCSEQNTAHQSPAVYSVCWPFQRSHLTYRPSHSPSTAREL